MEKIGQMRENLTSSLFFYHIKIWSFLSVVGGGGTVEGTLSSVFQMFTLMGK